MFHRLGAGDMLSPGPFVADSMNALHNPSPDFVGPGMGNAAFPEVTESASGSYQAIEKPSVSR
jgi:hypothetical protein